MRKRYGGHRGEELSSTANQQEELPIDALRRKWAQPGQVRLGSLSLEELAAELNKTQQGPALVLH